MFWIDESKLEAEIGGDPEKMLLIDESRTDVEGMLPIDEVATEKDSSLEMERGEVRSATDGKVTVLNGFVDRVVTVGDGLAVVTQGRAFAGQSAVFMWQSACDAVTVSFTFPSLTDIYVSLGSGPENTQSMISNFWRESASLRKMDAEVPKNTHFCSVVPTEEADTTAIGAELL
jgi:hypothetical protein